MPSIKDFAYGLRPDGTKKERGYLGELLTPEGEIMTEYSIGFDDGDIPSIVPTLHPAELNYILQRSEVPASVFMKLIKHADMRKKQGKSPFWNQQQDSKKIKDIYRAD